MMLTTLPTNVPTGSANGKQDTEHCDIISLIINGITQLAVKVYIPYIDTSHWPQVTASVVVTDAKGRGVFALLVPTRYGIQEYQ